MASEAFHSGANRVPLGGGRKQLLLSANPFPSAALLVVRAGGVKKVCSLAATYGRVLPLGTPLHSGQVLPFPSLSVYFARLICRQPGLKSGRSLHVASRMVSHLAARIGV